MKNRDKKLTLLCITVVLAFVAVGCAGPSSTPAATTSVSATSAPAVSGQKATKVCMLLAGSINDMSWCQSGYSGLQRIGQLPNVTTAYVENVQPTDYAAAARNFAANGCNLVLGHGAEWDTAIADVAPQFPNVFFVDLNGSHTGANLANVAPNDEQVSYLAGSLAGLVSKTHKVGFLSGADYAAIKRQQFGYSQGAQANGASVVSANTGDMEDATKAKEATIALAQQGADVMYYYLDQAGTGVDQACVEQGCHVIGTIVDQYSRAPSVYLSSALQDVGALHLYITKLYLQGQLKGQAYLVGIDTPGAEGLAPLHNVTPDIEQKMQQITQDVLSGKITVPRATLQ